MNNDSIYLVSGLFQVRYSPRDRAVVFLLLCDNKMPQQKLLSWRSFLTVEPIILFYAYGLFTSLPLFRQYVYSVISDGKGFPYKELIMEKEGPGCHEDVFGANATLKRLEEEVRRIKFFEFTWQSEGGT